MGQSPPGAKAAGLLDDARSNGLKSRIHPVLSSSRGTSSPGERKADGPINLERFNNRVSHTRR